jgi:cell surface protein SprA
MYLHGERAQKTDPASIRDKDLTAVIRLGTDFVNNYYEVRIPLILTPHSAGPLNADSDEYNDTLWNMRNSLDLDLTLLTKLKQARNLSSTALGQIFRQMQANGHEYSVMGNPNLGEIKGVLIGVENTHAAEPICGEVWANELRLSSLDEKGGYAALGRVDVNLADLGTVSVSANMHTKGFGTLEQRVNDRYRDNFLQFDVSANLELGKVLPKKLGMSIPVYASYSQTASSPEYDPYDQDIKLKDKIKDASGKAKDSIRNAAIDFVSIKTLNFTNVRKNKTNGKKPKIYDIENVDVSYSYIKTSAHSPLIEYNDVTRHRGALGYNYAPQPKYLEPFKNMFKKSKHHWFDLLKEFNINYIPSQLTFRADISRQFGVVRPRSVGASKYAIPETYDKYFVFQRDYIMRWNFTRSLQLDYTATNNSRIDEPMGRLDTKEKKDSVWKNLLRGGRNTLFNQTANFSYTLPTSKLPLLDWTTMNLKYQASYRWIGASRLAVELGNFLENGQQKEATVQLDFNRLYQKSKFLKQLEVPSKPEDKAKWKNRITITRDIVTHKNRKRVLKKKRVVDKTSVP